MWIACYIPSEARKNTFVYLSKIDLKMKTFWKTTNCTPTYSLFNSKDFVFLFCLSICNSWVDISKGKGCVYVAQFASVLAPVKAHWCYRFSTKVRVKNVEHHESLQHRIRMIDEYNEDLYPWTNNSSSSHFQGAITSCWTCSLQYAH